MKADSLVTKSPNGKRTRRGPHTRQQILDASLRLFSERGFARTTVRDIARQAGITDAAIYYHFESKRELLEALVEERGFINRLQNLQRHEPEGPLEDAILRMARGAIAIMDENRDFLRLIFMEGLGGDEAALEQYRRLIDMWEKALTAVLTRYAARGDLPPEDAPLLARQVIYTILMSFEESLLGRHLPPRASAQQRREAQEAFVYPALSRILQSSLQPAR
jgi:AcrR family transcriptional regulator